MFIADLLSADLPCSDLLRAICRDDDGTAPATQLIALVSHARVLKHEGPRHASRGASRRTPSAIWAGLAAP